MQTSAWPQVAALAIQISIVPSSSMPQRYQYVFRLRLIPQASIWPSVVAQATDINTDLVAIRPQAQTWPSVAGGFTFYLSHRSSVS